MLKLATDLYHIYIESTVRNGAMIAFYLSHEQQAFLIVYISAGLP